jgi:malonyl-CoA O-methyltransferase
MFSTFGPDTLKELRASFADGYVHTQRFTDMHDYGDMLVECGFADPVMDAEMLTMTYASFDDLLADLRRSGSGCAMRARRHGLMGRSAWAEARAAYEQTGAPDAAGDHRSGLRTRLEGTAEEDRRRAGNRPFRP